LERWEAVSNHFLEIQKDKDGFVWVMIHSGSRNIGKCVEEKFTAIARDLNSKWYSMSSDIPFLPVETEEGKCYLSWMEFALKFAFMNRKVMMDKVVRIFDSIFGEDFEILTDDISDGLMINIHHNYASLENHHGKNVWTHRKGSTLATEKTIGIIPGSMGTNSYIVKGKGNHFSLNSCSHGAGRKMGRKEFSRQMKDSYDKIEKSLEGVLHSKFGKFEYGKDKGLLDVSEAPDAYKDIQNVMALQSDLVTPLVELRPLISVKG
jgi:tRNA-splicing ligase RtcB (3'-phosphate/5'-hydroxy nucleic acid ligase)